MIKRSKNVATEAAAYAYAYARMNANESVNKSKDTLLRKAICSFFSFFFKFVGANLIALHTSNERDLACHFWFCDPAQIDIEMISN